MKHTPLTLLAIAALTLTACGSNSDEPEATPVETTTAEATTEELTPEQEERRDAMLNESTTVGHGTYRVHAVSGTELEFELPADTTHEVISEIDSLREELGIEPVTYIFAEIDNRQGDTLAALPQINAYDEDGTEYQFQSLPFALPEWEPEYGGEDDTAYWNAYDQLNALEEEHHDSVSPAGVGQTVLIYQGNDLPEEFTRIATYPNGVGQADDAYLAD